MLLHIILDLNIPAWEVIEEDPLNNIQVFINAFVLSRHDNIVRIINNRRVIYDSLINKSFQSVFDYLSLFSKANQNESLRVTPKDLGFALLDKADAILIYEMSNEHQSDYLDYLKCMFVAQTKGIKIHGFSHRKNMLVKMCSEGSQGRYLESCSLKNMIGLLGLEKTQKDSYGISCTCCNKHTNLAMVCPICLAVYCKFLPVCKKCKTKFSFNK